MNPIEMATALKFLMGKLSEADLAELDAQLADGAEPLAMDAARKSWLGLDAASRQHVRRAKVARMAGDTAGTAAYNEQFPNAGRLG